MNKTFAVLFTVLLAFSCSQDSTETQETIQANLSLTTPDKALDNSSDGLYVGVFGHNAIRELHGKLLISNNNYGTYAALIKLTNGHTIKFSGERVSKTITHFFGEFGSFDLDASNIENPTIDNIVVNTITDAYMVVVKAKSGIIPLVLTGTYEETGNEASFYGNWDVIGTGVENPLFPGSQDVATVVVSHLGSGAPLIDNTMEVMSASCAGPILPIIVIMIDGITPDALAANDQSSLFNGHVNAWSITFDPFGGYSDASCTAIPSGQWSWNGKSGAIYSDLIVPPTFTDITTGESRFWK